MRRRECVVWSSCVARELLTDGVVLPLVFSCYHTKTCFRRYIRIRMSSLRWGGRACSLQLGPRSMDTRSSLRRPSLWCGLASSCTSHQTFDPNAVPDESELSPAPSPVCFQVHAIDVATNAIRTIRGEGHHLHRPAKGPRKTHRDRAHHCLLTNYPLESYSGATCPAILPQCLIPSFLKSRQVALREGCSGGDKVLQRVLR